jgi:hypothetical protein
MRGYMNAKHHFGRNVLIRNVDTCYLIWQYRSTKRFTEYVILLSRSEYTFIKTLLGPVEKEIIKARYKTIEYYHTHSPKYYMRVKRHLQKKCFIKGGHNETIRNRSKNQTDTKR